MNYDYTIAILAQEADLNSPDDWWSTDAYYPVYMSYSTVKDEMTVHWAGHPAGYIALRKSDAEFLLKKMPQDGEGNDCSLTGPSGIS